ncbi:SAM-dependent methyltransferase [bacterium]|nr:SAM-dependent methyltransferase [bacterium]
MKKKTALVSHLLNKTSAASFLRQLSSDGSSSDRKALSQVSKVQAWAGKWHQLVKEDEDAFTERKTYQAFLAELLDCIGLTRFNGRNGTFDFERASKKRPHDCALGDLKLDDAKSVMTTVIEAKKPDWHLDLDRNEKGETVLEQAINVSEGNPFLRQVLTTNYHIIRVYLPLFGFEFFQEFTIEQIENSESDALLFVAFLTPSISVDPSANPQRLYLQATVERTLKDRKRKIDALYGTYISALNGATTAVASVSSGLEPVEHRQLATQYVNRFLFSEYAHQCGLLPASVRDVLKDSGKDFSLIQFFSLLDKGGDRASIRYPHFNGGLFAKNATLDKLTPSSALRKELMNLTEIELSDLAPQVLGRIFEQSLSDDLSELPNSPTESHALGAVYTPSDLASAMVRLSFELVGEKNATVLDPACGSGVFLLESLKYLLHGSKRSSQEIESLLNKRIAGWDINPAAVELTRFMIWQYVSNLDLPLPNIQNNVHVGDALLDKIEGYSRSPDIVIGNPPFIAHQNLRRGYKDALEKKYELTLDPNQQYDIYVAFFEKALSVVKEDGVVALIAPNQLAFRPYGKRLRDHLLSNHRIERIVDLTEVPVFDKAICPFVYVIQKGRASRAARKYPVYTDIRERKGIIDAFEFPEPKSTDFIELAHDVQNEFLARGRVSSGVKSFDLFWDADHEEEITNVGAILAERPSRGRLQVIKGGKSGQTISVATSKLENDGPAIKRCQVSAQERARAQERYGADKIVFPRFFPSQMVTRLVGPAIAVADNVYYLRADELKADSGWDLELLNHLFNSRLYSLLDYGRAGLDRINEIGFRALDGDKFCELPLPKVDEKRLAKFRKLAKEASFHLTLVDTADSFDERSRTNEIRLRKVIEFERDVAALFGIELTAAETRAVLKWWAARRAVLSRQEAA